MSMSAIGAVYHGPVLCKLKYQGLPRAYNRTMYRREEPLKKWTVSHTKKNKNNILILLSDHSVDRHSTEPRSILEAINNLPIPYKFFHPANSHPAQG
jgi:hypothetical protein